MGYQTDLVAGLASILADAGAGTWSPTGTYAATDTAITIRAMPATPDACITLSPYAVSDDAYTADSVTGVQVMMRTGETDPRTTDDLCDAVFAVLHGIYAADVGGVPVQSVARHSSLSLGRDDLNRWVTSDNYYVTALHPAPHRM